MKVLIVSGHFSPDVGYQEVRLAGAHVRLGHRVRVLTTTYVPPQIMLARPREYRPGRQMHDGYEIVRLRTLARLGSTMVPLGMRREIGEFEPDVTICVGIAKFMPVIAAFWKRRFGYRLISYFSDAYKHRRTTSTSPRARVLAAAQRVVFATLKKRWYRYVINRSDRVVAITPETEGIISSEYLGSGNGKLRFLPLGFDEGLFFFEPGERDEIRRRYRIDDGSPLLVTATKFEESKRIETLIEVFERLPSDENPPSWLLIGFGRGEYANSIRRRVESSTACDRIHCLRFMEAAQLRAHYNAADIGVWTRETITIQEAMGTGLWVVLPRTDPLSHLVREGETGYLWSTEKEMQERLEEACRDFATPGGSLAARREVVERNRWLSYAQLAEGATSGL